MERVARNEVGTRVFEDRDIRITDTRVFVENPPPPPPPTAHNQKPPPPPPPPSVLQL